MVDQNEKNCKEKFKLIIISFFFLVAINLLRWARGAVPALPVFVVFVAVADGVGCGWMNRQKCTDAIRVQMVADDNKFPNSAARRCEGKC